MVSPGRVRTAPAHTTSCRAQAGPSCPARLPPLLPTVSCPQTDLGQLGPLPQSTVSRSRGPVCCLPWQPEWVQESRAWGGAWAGWRVPLEPRVGRDRLSPGGLAQHLAALAGQWVSEQLSVQQRPPCCQAQGHLPVSPWASGSLSRVVWGLTALPALLCGLTPSLAAPSLLTLKSLSEGLFSCSVVSNSLPPHGLRHARLPCPSTSPSVYSNSRPSVMPSNHLILCRPLLLPPLIFPSIRVFSHKSVLRIRWPNY